MAGRPLRNSEVLTHDVSGETVVYHLTSDTVHALDEATAGVWRVCDGERTTRDLVAALKADGLAPTVTLAALDELERVGLLVPGSHTPGQDGVSRRRLLRNVGVGAVMVPTIISVLAPDPAAAQSPRCGGPGATCTDDTGCCPGYVCVDGHCVDEAEHDAAAAAAPAAAGLCRPVDEICVRDEECCPGLLCDGVSLTCQPAPDAAQSSSEAPQAAQPTDAPAPTDRLPVESPSAAQPPGPSPQPEAQPAATTPPEAAPAAPPPAPPPPAAAPPPPPPPAPPPRRRTGSAAASSATTRSGTIAYLAGPTSDASPSGQRPDARQQAPRGRRAWTALGLCCALIVWATLVAALRGGSALPLTALIVAGIGVFAASRFVTLRNPSLTAGVIVVFALALVALHPDSLQSSPLTGPFGYANATAAFLVLAGTATAVLARHTRSRPLSAALLMVALAVAATSFLIGSVAAVVSAVVLAVGTIASFASPRIRRGAVVVGITAVLCAQVGTAVLGSMCLAR